MAACQAYPPTAGYLRGMLDFIDCEAQSIGDLGYHALAAPGSSVAFALTGMLTLFVAMFGYRMLLGEVPTIRDSVVALVKIGIVIALASSWPAYRTLVYDVTLRAPAEIMAQAGTAAQLPGAEGGLGIRLDTADQMLDRLAAAGVGAKAGPPNQPFPGQTIRPVDGSEEFGGFDGFALGAARLSFMVGTIGALGITRLTAGIMLALGPLFLGFLLFDRTRGLTEGWLRIVIGAAIGALAVSFVLGIELSLLEPWLSDLLARRYASLPIFGFPVPVLATMLIFDTILAAIVFVSFRLALGLRLTGEVRRTVETSAPLMLRSADATPIIAHATSPASGRSRAAAIVDSVAIAQRRENALSSVPMPNPNSATVTRVPMNSAAQSKIVGPMPSQNVRRHARPRISGSARRRDNTA